jgi:polyisoprenoid-binding protein YceI
LTGSHNGTLALKNGNLLFDGKKLVGGEFVADMTSLKEAEGNERLEKHLKSDDFFAVDKFAEAKFTIKNVSGSGADVQVTGDFNIKGKVNSVSFPVKLVWNKDKTVTATAEKITIDRTKYGIEYKSKSVFSTLGNNFIDDEFTISVKLVAKK